MRHRFARVCLLVSGLWLATPAAAQDDPTAVVHRLNNTLLEVMREAEALGFTGRYQRLEPVLGEIFAFPTMARIAAGGHWRGLSTEQRERLADAFARFSIATYANRFDGFSGERFEVGSEQDSVRGSTLVDSRIITGDGERVELNYLLRQNDGHWRIFDIYLNGSISELATRRSEYTSILDNRGFDSLISQLEARIADLQGNPG